MSVKDISADYRNYLMQLLEEGEYDHLPNFKRLAFEHLLAWNDWAEICEELCSYGVLKTILFLPRFIYLNHKAKKLYEDLKKTQGRLSSWTLRNPGVLEEIEHSRAIKVLMNKDNIQ